MWKFLTVIILCLSYDFQIVKILNFASDIAPLAFSARLSEVHTCTHTQLRCFLFQNTNVVLVHTIVMDDQYLYLIPSLVSRAGSQMIVLNYSLRGCIWT